MRRHVASSAKDASADSSTSPKTLIPAEISPVAKTEHVTSPLRDMVELILCTLSIYFCYLGYGLLHERITRHGFGVEKERFTYSTFLTTTQCLGNSMWALMLLVVEAFRRGHAETDKDPLPHHVPNRFKSFPSRLYHLIFDPVPKHQYALVALSYSVAMLSSTAALRFISYPIQALAKSSKLIPVMVGRILCGSKRYAIREYIHVVLITGGIAAFFYFEKTSTSGPSHSSWFGLGLLALSLTMDAITGPTQEKINDDYKPTVMTMTFWINIFPFSVMGVIVLMTGELDGAVAFMQRHPELVSELIMYCILSAIGQSVIVWGLFRFNSMTITIITTIRKFFTIIVSVIWFQNTLNLLQWAGVSFVFLGIGLDAQFKYSLKKAKHAAHKASSHGSS